MPDNAKKKLIKEKEKKDNSRILEPKN